MNSMPLWWLSVNSIQAKGEDWSFSVVLVSLEEWRLVSSSPARFSPIVLRYLFQLTCKHERWTFCWRGNRHVVSFFIWFYSSVFFYQIKWKICEHPLTYIFFNQLENRKHWIVNGDSNFIEFIRHTVFVWLQSKWKGIKFNLVN